MNDECEQQVGLLFSMPIGQTMEIRSSKPLPENLGSDEEIEGIVYRIYWNNVALPWCTKTQLQATAIAFGCQYGANEMHKRFRSY